MPSLASLALADDVWVDARNRSCSDSAPGTGQAPFCSIGAALAAHHAPGTTIHLMPGVYHETVTVPASGQSGSPIVLRSEGGPDHPAVIDGADDFSNPGSWLSTAGGSWLATAAQWRAAQVFVDGARLDSSSAPPESLPPRTFSSVPGVGVYVRLGGENPGTHQVEIGHRAYGVALAARSWISLDGLEVARADDRGILLSKGCSDVEITRGAVHDCGHMGVQASGSTAVHLAGERVSGNGDHGISLTEGTSGCTIENDETWGNGGSGIYLSVATGNRIQANLFHDEGRAGEDLEPGANDNLSIQNRSFRNAGPGYDHIGATGNVHNGDLAFDNRNDGFSVNLGSTGTTIENCVSFANALRHYRYDLAVDASSTGGLASDDNLFWNPNGNAPIRYAEIPFLSVPDFTAVTGQDAHTIEHDPHLADPQSGDFRPLPGSVLIDSGNSSSPGWSSVDAAGQPRMDDPASPNRGRGLVAFADRGPLEYVPGQWAPAVGDTVPRMDHVIVVIMENKPYGLVRVAPYTKSLIDRYSSFVNSYAYQHQSQSDYYAIWSAVGRGVTESICPAAGSPYFTENFGHRCEASGVSWRAYSEGLPFPGDTVCSKGLYVRRHAPWADWGNLSHMNERPYTDLVGDIARGTLPRLAFVVPNLCNDTHNACEPDTILHGDGWLHDNLPAMIDGVGPRGLVILTWDEDDGSDGNHILTVFASPLGKPGDLSKRYVNHFVVARTICDAIGIPAFGEAANVEPVTDVWDGQSPALPVPPGGGITLGLATPNPFRGAVSAVLRLDSPQAVDAAVFDLAGRKVKSLLQATRNGIVQIRWDGSEDAGRSAPAGIYMLRVRAGGTTVGRKLVLLHAAG